MHAGVLSFRIQPNMMDELTRIWQEEATQLVRSFHGFRECFLFVQPETGQVMSIGLWETEADAMDFGSSDEFEQVCDMFADMAIEPLTRTVYRVTTATRVEVA